MDRKALIREYKESRRPMGVFRVRNVAERKSLIGVSVDLPAILNRQLAQLRMGVHRIRELQDDWKRLGPEGFAFEVVDTLKPSEEPGYDPAKDLEVLLQMWREKLLGDGERLYRG
jgi:hypothetical protein